MVHRTEQPEGRRERKRAERSERMAQAALELVVEEGLEALTMQRLARKLDLAVGALYRYFPSKEALLAELQRRVIGAFHEDLRSELARLEPALGRGRAAGLVPLVALAHLYFTWPERAPTQFRLIALMVGDPRDVLPDLEAAPNVARMLELGADILGRFEAAVKRGALKPGSAGQRALFLWASVHGLLQLRKLGRFDAGLFRGRELFSELLRTLLVGWGARAEDFGAALQTLDTGKKERG